MKSNLFFFLLLGLIVYLIVKTKRQLVATQAAIQADNPLIAIQPGTETTSTQNETPVDYLSVYNNA
ncbi:hypothetical protein [Larkinella harenae]